MSIFNSLQVKGLRRLRDTSLKLKPLNVLVGANSSGKSTLLDAMCILSVGAAGQMHDQISQLGGYASLQTNLSACKGQNIRFVLDQNTDTDQPLKYVLEMAPKGVDYSIAEEILGQNRGRPTPFIHISAHQGDTKYFDLSVENRLVRPTWDINPFESALSQVPKMFKEPEDFRKKLSSSTYYRVLDVSSNAPVRLPQAMRSASLPGQDGENLISCLYNIRETDPDRFALIEDCLRAGFKNFERLNFPAVAAGVLALTWKDRTSSSPFYLHQLSDGTLRFLWLATLLNSPGLTAVTMIDEPEVSLHPELMSVLADLLREASQHSQIIVATHSDRLVRHLMPDELIATELAEDGAAQFQWGDEFDIEHWLKDFTLDQLWSMGRLGARA